jgi:hypothetical protein
VTDEFLAYLEGQPAHPGSPNNSNDPDQVLPVTSLEEAEAAVYAEAESWVQAVVQLRHSVPWPGLEATPYDLDDALTRVRAVMDRVEAILGHSLALRWSAEGRAKTAEQAADDAWNERAARDRRTRHEYEGAKERYAYWELDIKAHRTAARKARALADYARNVSERIRLSYDGLNETRRDLNSRLTRLRWDATMER